MPNPIKQWKHEHPELWQKLLDATGGRCPLCRKKYSRTRLPVADHEHEIGLVRGCLCMPCNDKLGFLHDDSGWLARAAEYIDSPPALRLIGEHYVPGSLGAHRRKQ